MDSVYNTFTFLIFFFGINLSITERQKQKKNYLVFRKFLVIAEFTQPQTLLCKTRINKDYKNCHDKTGSQKFYPTL